MGKSKNLEQEAYHFQLNLAIDDDHHLASNHLGHATLQVYRQHTTLENATNVKYVSRTKMHEI